MKKTLGRLGAVAAAVGLVAAGLVGTATSASSSEGVICGWGTGDFGSTAQRNAEEACEKIRTNDNEQIYAEPPEKGVHKWIASARLPLDALPAGFEKLDEPTGWDQPSTPEIVPDGSGAGEAVQKAPPPPPCWDSSLNNCPVGGALRFTAPKYAMVGVPVTMYAYASWRPDGNAPSQPTNGTAVIRVDGEDYSGVEFKDGVAEWRFIPETEGMKEFTASGVLFSGLSGANAYIDTVPARTYVLEYDPAAYATALKNKRVEVGDTYVITDPNQARSYLEDRYEWSVSEKSDDVCAVYETKKGAVKAKFTDSGKCTVIWLDKESEESGKYTFIAKK